MGRFRTFSKHKTVDSSEYNKDLDAKSFYSYARVKSSSKSDINFNINNCTHDVETFKNYDTFLKFSRGMSLLSPCMNFYDDVPTNLDQGIEALIYYSDVQTDSEAEPEPEPEAADNSNLFSCDSTCCDLLKNVNKCTDNKSRLYPYGYVNNNTLGRSAMFPSRINVFYCENKIEGPKYKICTCSGDEPEPEPEPEP